MGIDITPKMRAKHAQIGGSGRRYPNRIFSLAEHYLPKNIKELFKYCEYYYLTHLALSQTITKSAEYPITDIIIETPNDELKDKYEELLHDFWNIRHLLIEIGTYYMTFGNAFVSMYFVQHRYAVCPNCKHKTSLRAKLAEKETKWRRLKVEGPCENCGLHSIEYELEDVRPKSANHV